MLGLEREKEKEKERESKKEKEKVIMDIEPIYCAEQIKIPPTLADALKAYTKEVIRAQPEDIIEFSVNYFTKLADFSSNLVVDATPDLEQIKEVSVTLAQIANPTVADFAKVCSGVGISPEILERAFSLESSDFDSSNAIVLLLTMVASNLENLLELTFEILGSEHHMPVSQIAGVLEFLSTRDESVTSSMKDKLKAALEGKEVASINEIKEVLFSPEE